MSSSDKLDVNSEGSEHVPACSGGGRPHRQGAAYRHERRRPQAAYCLLKTRRVSPRTRSPRSTASRTGGVSHLTKRENIESDAVPWRSLARHRRLVRCRFAKCRVPIYSIAWPYGCSTAGRPRDADQGGPGVKPWRNFRDQGLGRPDSPGLPVLRDVADAAHHRAS